MPVLSERAQSWHVGTCKQRLEVVKFMTQTELGGMSWGENIFQNDHNIQKPKSDVEKLKSSD